VSTQVELLSLGQGAKRCGIAASALRFYESRGLINSVRSSGNQRRYPRAIMRRVAVIRAAQTLGLTLEEIAQALTALPTNARPRKLDWERMSQRWQARLAQQISSLEQLRDKLSACIGCGCLSMESCALFNAHARASKRGAGPRYLMGDEPLRD